MSDRECNFRVTLEIVAVVITRLIGCARSLQYHCPLARAIYDIDPITGSLTKKIRVSLSQDNIHNNKTAAQRIYSAENAAITTHLKV